jgi:hypothetical protein
MQELSHNNCSSDSFACLTYWQFSGVNITLLRVLCYVRGSEQNNYNRVYLFQMGRDSSIGIATRYGLDGPGIESRRIFRTLPDRPWAHHNGYGVSFPGVKRPGRGVNHPPPSSAEVKERVQLYLFSLSGPSCPVLGWTLPLPLLTHTLQNCQ